MWRVFLEGNSAVRIRKGSKHFATHKKNGSDRLSFVDDRQDNLKCLDERFFLSHTGKGMVHGRQRPEIEGESDK